MVSYRAIQVFLEEAAPPYLEEEWDNSGFQVKRDRDEVERLLVGLDPTRDLIQYGVNRDVELIITHHPLIFNSLEGLEEGTLVGSKLLQLIDNQIDLVSIHTPFDHSARGLSDALAERLGLRSSRVLKPVRGGNLLRMIVFVPPAHEAEVVDALQAVGLGSLGNYSNSYYRVRSEGFFTPSESATPARGARGKGESTAEARLEFILSPDLKDRAVSALMEVHPYEEPGYSIEETERINPEVGLGRIGHTTRPLGLEDVVDLVTESLNTKVDEMKITGEPDGPITTLAVSPGAGGAGLYPAINSEAGALVTGELDYHERMDAYEEGLVVVEIGHFHSEKIFVPRLTELFEEEFSRSELEIFQYMEGTRGE
ncbi:Nif3-like dinuclear metal center hexameric protein [Candidatus Bipolaricaulota bacterium]|nr:Nif3-like dinuclear metal center hexameric protein [Candidatus Bipolaricaulota bacterium]